jgi:predicted DNA-binding transcriptional regulator YafY
VADVGPAGGKDGRRAALGEFVRRACHGLRVNVFGIGVRRLARLAGVSRMTIVRDVQALDKAGETVVAEVGGWSKHRVNRYAPPPDPEHDYSTAPGIVRAHAREACWRRAYAAVPSSAGGKETVKARAAARRALLLAYAQELAKCEGPGGFRLGVEEVAERLAVSTSTARRDLAALRRSDGLRLRCRGNSHSGRTSSYDIGPCPLSAAA